jgi:hypothetical protein
LPILAHHDFSSAFDKDKPVTLTGRLETISWSEPHTIITMNVPSGDAKGDWTLEAASANTLRKNSGQPNLRVGSTVTIHAYRAIDGSMKASARSVETQDGRRYALSDPQEDRGPRQ